MELESGFYGVDEMANGFYADVERLNGFSWYALFGFAGCASTGTTETEIETGISFLALNLRNFHNVLCK